MPKIKNIFARGVMDKQRNKAFLEKHAFRHSENLRFNTSGSNDGIGKKIKGSLLVSDVTSGSTDLKCVTAYFNQDLNVIYYFLASTNGAISKIVEYNIDNGNTTIVCEDNSSILNLVKGGYITGINEIDGLLYWSEWGNNPRRINIERAKTYGINGFDENDIMVLVKPPLQKLRITLESAETPTQEENNIVENMFAFSYRYRYIDGEYSALAPFTKYAFFPKPFRYDYSEQSMPSMVNTSNQVKIEFNTGSKNVTEIQLVFIESNNDNAWIIDDFDKSKLGYGNDQIVSFDFVNNKVKRALPKEILRKYFDNVPRTNLCQTMINGRLLYAHYKENYNIVDADDIPIEIDYDLELEETNNTEIIEVTDYDENGNPVLINITVPTLNPLRTVKSNRDYQVGLVYTDGHGRSSTILLSKTDTIYIPNSNSVTGNSIIVNLRHKPPKWATHYRFFIKQNKKNYDNVFPTLFYEDGVYRWIKLEGADKEKVKEGDFLIVKSDTQEPVDTLVKVKVLEVKEQPKNFLQAEDVTDSIIEKSGLYFKIKPDGFRIDIEDFESYNLSTYDNTRNAYNNPIASIAPYIGYAHFYGDTLDDLTSNQGGGYTGVNDERNRYRIQILTIGATDTFRWSDDDGTNWDDNGGAGYPITGGAQALNNGVEITFGAVTGHSLNDEWTINARSTWTRKNSGRAYGFFRTTGYHYDTLQSLEDEKIRAGARINLIYDEYGRGDDYFNIDVIAQGNYDNIQEWFYEENIINLITAQCGLVYDDIHFMRGVIEKNDNATRIYQNDSDGIMTMCVRSVEHGTGTSRVKVSAKSDIIQSVGYYPLLFETEPTQQPEDIYFEIGKTYRISGGYHLAVTDDYETEIPDTAGDVSQSISTDLRVKLDWFNAFSYGNSVETYKVKDEWNGKGLAVGVRTLSDSEEEYKEVVRRADIQWSNRYEDETNFNGLNDFNLTEVNFEKLDKENGSIQKIDNANGNLLVLQEDGTGLMAYEKSIIEDADGNQTIQAIERVLDSRSYRPYAGINGTTNPESYIAVGIRKYYVDKQRANLVRLSIDGTTDLDMYLFESEFSDLMIQHKSDFLIGGFDPKHGEYLLSLPKLQNTLAFKESQKGFPTYYTFEPDFMVYANNEMYAWKQGRMYKMNNTNQFNEFFGQEYPSKILYYANEEFSVEKVAKAIGIESTHSWDVNIATNLASRNIPKNSFIQKEDYWFSEIMGNTNGNPLNSSNYGLGTYPIVQGVITTLNIPETLSVGDYIRSNSISFPDNQVIDIQDNKIFLQNNITTTSSFLFYLKNSNVDGASIRGDIFEVELVNDDNEDVELRAVNLEVSKSEYS